MRKSSWTPSIVPRGDDQDIYLVVDDLGRLGRVWREADFETADFETVVTDLLEDQYKNPLGIFCFNPAEGWSRDASEGVAREVRRRCDLQLRDVPSSIREFVESYEGRERQLPLPLRLAYPDEMPALRGIGWVCAEHPERPFEGSRACPCGAAGAPCPDCNEPSEGIPRMPTGFKTRVEKNDRRH